MNNKFYTEFYTEQKHKETMNSVDMLEGSKIVCVLLMI